MMIKSHFAVGILGWNALCAVGAASPDPLLIAAVAVGAVAPDIDEPNSYIGRRLGFLSWPISNIFGHRGFTHSLLGTAAFCLLTVVVLVEFVEAANLWALALGVGYASHQLADYFTNSGIPVLWPSKKRYRAPIGFKTGGVAERIFCVFTGISSFISSYYLY